MSDGNVSRWLRWLPLRHICDILHTQHPSTCGNHRGSRFRLQWGRNQLVRGLVCSQERYRRSNIGGSIFRMLSLRRRNNCPDIADIVSLSPFCSLDVSCEWKWKFCLFKSWNKTRAGVEHLLFHLLFFGKNGFRTKTGPVNFSYLKTATNIFCLV